MQKGNADSLDSFSGRRDCRVRLRAAVAIKLPGVADLANQIEIEIGDHDIVGVPRAFGQYAATRIAEITLAIKLADSPRLLPAGPINRADEVTIGDRVSWLFELPQIFGKARHGR